MNKNYNNDNEPLYEQWGTKRNKKKKIILILIIVLVILLIIGVAYERLFSSSSPISDEEYLKIKEEYQEEINDKKQNYTLNEKIIYGEEIKAVFINSSLRNNEIISSNNIYPFANFLNFLKGYNSNSSIYEINTNNIENINKAIDNIDEPDNEFSILKYTDLIVIACSDTQSSSYDQLLKKISEINTKKVKIFITVEASINNDKKQQLRVFCNDRDYTLIDLSGELNEAKNSDIHITKNNQLNDECTITKVYSDAIIEATKNK